MKPIVELLQQNDRLQNIILKGFDPVMEHGFTKVPNLLLRSSKLSNNAKIVYAKLLSYAWENQRCFPGQERMVEDIGTSQPTISRSLMELQKAGWLEIERRGQGKTNVYILTYVARVDKSVHKRG